MKKNNIRDFLLYLIVGGIATIAEWMIFFLLGKISIHYTIGTVIAYMLSTFVNWLAGRLLVFKDAQKTILMEILGIYAASVIGLLLNLLIMWIAVDMFGVDEMISKIAATVIVFFYNFLIRKFLIYRT